MIKHRTIFAIAAILIIILGIQDYMIFKLNSRINQLNARDYQAYSSQIKTPMPPNLTLSQSDWNDEFFNNHPRSIYEEMQRMQKEIEQLFNDSFSRFHLDTPLSNLNKVPDVDLQEKSDAYIVTINAPGADASSLQVKLEDRILHISIKTEHAEDQTDEKNGHYNFRERFIGEFQRVLTLPGPADATKMKTDYRNGVLTITIPKQ